MQILYSKGKSCSVNDLLSQIDSFLEIKGGEYLNIKDYDLKDTVNIDDMHLLIMYRKMLQNKLVWCSDCFSEHNKQEISSKILDILY